MSLSSLVRLVRKFNTIILI
ncbi:hypothetical protein YPPY03_3491, partial [Yersinia pestis PY-03]